MCAQKAADDDDDDLDLFGDETEEEKKAAEEREAAAKASSKKKESKLSWNYILLVSSAFYQANLGFSFIFSSGHDNFLTPLATQSLLKVFSRH